MTPVENLPPISTPIAKLVEKFAPGLVETGGKFAAMLWCVMWPWAMGRPRYPGYYMTWCSSLWGWWTRVTTPFFQIFWGRMHGDPGHNAFFQIFWGRMHVTRIPMPGFFFSTKEARGPRFHVRMLHSLGCMVTRVTMPFSRYFGVGCMVTRVMSGCFFHEGGPWARLRFPDAPFPGGLVRGDPGHCALMADTPIVLISFIN